MNEFRSNDMDNDINPTEMPAQQPLYASNYPYKAPGRYGRDGYWVADYRPVPNRSYDSIDGRSSSGYIEDEVDRFINQTSAPRHAATAPRSTKNHDQRNIKIIVIVGLAVIVAGILAIIFLPKSGNGITAVQQPANASQVAASLHCTSVKDFGPSLAGGVVDSATCYKGAVKYSIDTFASQGARDAWLQTAEKMGVNPKWETATSVTYKSIAG